ncbi:hypothetical protein HQ587_10510 [bacterium]|nr:hypothetical protein [bacterium]
MSDRFPFQLLLIVLLAFAVSSSAQPDGPFIPDEHTFGLWHMDQSEPDSLWSVTYGGEANDQIRTAVRTSDGNYVAAGYTKSFGNGERDIMLMKLHDNGRIVWVKTYGSDQFEICNDLLELENGDLIMVGASGVRAREDFLFFMTGAGGDSLWSRTYGGDRGEICYLILPLEDGGYMLGGSTRSYGCGLYDMWIVRIDSAGEMLWSMPFGGEGSEICYTISPCEDGGYLLGGYTTSEVERSMGWIVKIDEDGDHLTAGRHRLIWDAKDYPAGIYLCRMEAEGEISTQKLVLVR